MEDQSKEIERLRLQVKNLEKLSSLGMLSAGIAHEIQNPLNFVINFSKLSSKLVDDLEDILEEEKDVLPPESWEKLTALHEEFSEIVNDLHGNLKKIETGRQVSSGVSCFIPEGRMTSTSLRISRIW